MNIYLDMDDVVADFKGYAESILKKKVENGIRFPDNEWSRLRDNPRIYRDLKVKDGADELVHFCQEWCLRNNTSLYFLTALPRKNDIPYAPYDKVLWARKHFRGIPVFLGPFSGDKWKHCEEGDILIDDRESNCKEWEAAGGKAFMYRSNWPDCKEWLIKELGLSN